MAIVSDQGFLRVKKGNAAFTTNTNQQDIDGIAITGDKNVIQSTDHGAVAGALDLIDSLSREQQETLLEAQAAALAATDRAVSGSLDAVDRISGSALDSIGEALRQSLGFGEQALSAVERSADSAVDAVQRVQGEAFTFATQNVRDEVAQGFETLVKWGTGAAALVAAVWLLKG